MNSLFTALLLLLSLPSFARHNPYCDDFVRIQAVMKHLTVAQVDRILPDVNWKDETLERGKRKQIVFVVGKTVVLVLLKRLTPLAYLFEPSPAGDGHDSFTGLYSSSPAQYLKFLELKPEQACMFLSMGDYDAENLRQITHELRTHLDHSSHR